MIRSQTFNLTFLLYLIPIVILLSFASLPLTVSGQEPAEETPEPEPTGAPLSNSFHLPLIISKAPPCDAPLLDTPPADALLTAGRPLTFSWRLADDCAAGYKDYSLQIAADPNFDPDAILHGVGSRLYGDRSGEAPYYQTNYVLTGTVPGAYYWRATASFSDTQGLWSEPRRFTLVSTGTQLLANPSFEADPDRIEPWQWLRPEETVYRVGRDSQIAYEGEQFLAVNRQDETSGNKSFYQEIETPPADTTYHFAVWVRASAEAIEAGRPRTGRLALWAFGGEAPREHGTHNFVIDQPGWRCIETKLTVAAAGHARLRAEVYLTALDDFDYYFDQAILRDDGRTICPPPPPSKEAVLVSEGQGFDACAAPGVDHLAAWKQASPYESVGVYLGGVSHYLPCALYNQQAQTPFWFSVVAQQGWQFIPIWVGPQAPCTSYVFRLSQIPDIAWQEGVAEARQALAAAERMGLVTASRPNTIVYYDMEYYPAHDPTCHAAVKAFLSGWVSELQSQGHKAGVYSSAFVANEWYRLLHVPDSIWTAWYMRPAYDPDVSIETVNQEWVSPSYWDNHRLFQYSNSHDETWGGVTLNIDNNAARGLVAAGGAAQARDLPILRKMDLLAPDQGWLWLDQRLWWTASGGERWTEITPPAAGAIADVLFLDEAQGWAASTPAPGRPVRLWRTMDGGRQWQSSTLEIFDTDEVRPISGIYLDFIDSDTGWLVVKLATGLNFSQGLLFKTEDGGATWTRLALPLGEPVRFVTETMGWVAGGPINSELYVTRDGGQTWQAQSIGSPATGLAAYTLPVFDDAQTGLIAVTTFESAQTAVDFYLTQDGGQTWQRREQVSLSQSFALGASPPISILDSQHWLVADPGLTPSFPANIVSLAWAAPTTGWAHVRDNVCAGRCERQSRLFQTTDAGQTWTEISFP